MTTSNTQSQQDITATLGLDKVGKRKLHLTRWLLALSALAIVVALALLYGLRSKKDSVQYVTQPASRGSLVVTVSASGTLEPINQVEVGIEVSGTIKTVEVDYNDQVKVNQVMARLDTSKFEAQVLQSEAALESTRAKVLQAQATVQETAAQMSRLERVFALSNGKMPSQSDTDAAKASLARAKADEASAKASMAQAQAALDVIRTDLSKSVIHSPIAGVVLKRSVEPGQTVAASLQSPVLFTLAEDLAKMELQIDIDEADVGQVLKGQEATFTVDAYPDRTFPAHVTQVRFGPQTVDGVVTYKTVMQVDNSSLVLRPGMTARAVITVNKVDNVLLIPNAALRFTPPTPQVTATSRGGGLMSAILPHPPRSESKKPDEGANGKTREQRVWTLRQGQLLAMTVTKGLSDGVLTEVTGSSLEPGMELVTDIVAVK